MPIDPATWPDLFAAIPVPVSVVDTHGRQLYANPAYGAFLGYDVDELAEIDIGRVTRPGDAVWTGTYLTRLASGEIDEFETEKVYVRKDGSETTAHLMARSVRGADGVAEALIATLIPIDPQARPSGSSSPLLDYTSDTVTVVDIDGNVLDTQGRQQTRMGYPAEFWYHRNIRDLVPPDDWPRLIELRDRAVEAPGNEVETEVEVLAADGSAQILHLRVVNCLDDPEIGGLVVVTRNVTEFRRTVAELSRRRETAEAVVDAQRRLLATVSHELRNPLHAVRGIAELLAAEDLPTGAAELAESLVRQISSLANVTQDLLTAARLDAGRIELQAVPTDLAALVGDVVELGRSAAGGRDIDIGSKIAHDVPGWVVVDPDRLRQVLGNLVGNAVKFTEAGSVQVFVRVDGPDALVVSVIDTGIGIPRAEQAAVLEPFEVASTAGDRRGAGLGLSIVARLVAAMDGRLSLTSASGEGTRFDVRLPLRRADAPVDTAEPTTIAGLTVLVVEDNPVNQQLAVNQLERLELRPIVVGTGEEGVAALTGSSGAEIDVVLMDHQLPGIDGLEATRRIRASASPRASIPIIGLSASASLSDRDRFIAGGMTGFVPKPASLDDLATAIGHAVDPQRVATESPSPPDGPVDDAVDTDVLERLADELGGSELVGSLARTFLDELDTRRDAIVAALAEDEVSARRAAHTLKSSARLLGAARLGDACAAIERDGRDAVGSNELVALVEQTRTGLERWLEAGP